MKKQDLYGMHPAIVTPFSESGEIMEDAFQQIVDFLIGLGATGICVAGDNGESWALSAEERGRLVRLAKDRAAGRVKVTCGCSAPTADASIGYARAALENGADALLSMPPTYVLKGSRSEILHRFEVLTKAVDLPIILYNSPRRHGYSLSADIIDAIINANNVIGLKESDRDFFHHTDILQEFSNRISVMTGPCHYIVPNFGLGSAGFIATGPEFLGKDAARISDLAVAGPSDALKDVHVKLTALYRMLMSIGTWPSAFKAALSLIGQPAGVPRDPVLPVGEVERDQIRATLDRLGIGYQA